MWEGAGPLPHCFVVFSGAWHAVDGAVYYGLGHFQQVPRGMDSGAVVGLQVIATVPHGG